MRRKVLAVLGFATGLAAGTFLYRRGTRGRRERVDLYFADGSMISLGDGTPGVDRLLPIARRILETARDGRSA
jgi:hypothetical protein